MKERRGTNQIVGAFKEDANKEMANIGMETKMNTKLKTITLQMEMNYRETRKIELYGC